MVEWYYNWDITGLGRPMLQLIWHVGRWTILLMWWIWQQHRGFSVCQPARSKRFNSWYLVGHWLRNEGQLIDGKVKSLCLCLMNLILNYWFLKDLLSEEFFGMGYSVRIKSDVLYAYQCLLPHIIVILIHQGLNIKTLKTSWILP